MNAQKSFPLTKEEVMLLVDLIQENPVLLSKATNASNNQLKDATWMKLTNIFNSKISSCPRRPEQLRLKWENLKKSARKKNTKIHMNNLKTGGGKPDFIPPDEALDKVASILGPTCDGYSVEFGGDAESSVSECVMLPLEDTEIVNVSLEQDPVTQPCSSYNTPSPRPLTPKLQKFSFTSVKGKGKPQRQKVADDLKLSIIKRNNSIADYYNSKKDLAALKKRKMELEILKLEKEVILNDQ